MKKYLSYVIIFLISFICISNIKAENINSIKMDVYVDSNGDAYVEEVWDVDATEKTEYYHSYYNIGDSSISDLTVRDEDHEYTYIDWDTNGDLSDKAYHYGYNYDYDGVELCFGKSSYNHHTYTLTYKINGFVYNTSDGKQIMYWTMLNKVDPAPDKVSIVIRSDEKYSHELPVWGYGNYGGYAFVGDEHPIEELNYEVHEGHIVLYNDHLSNTDSMVFLAEFDEPIFNTEYSLDQTNEEIKDMAKKGSNLFEPKESLADKIFDAIAIGFTILCQVVVWGVIIFAIFASTKTTYGTKNLKFSKTNRKIPKDINMFRDLPCGKNIKRAYWIAAQYGLIKKKTDYLGAILLKWLKEGKVQVQSKEKGIFKKDKTNIVFVTETIETDDVNENNLYKYMYEASIDGVLESKEFEKWCKKHYNKILKWFDKVIDDQTEKFTQEGRITKKETTGLFGNTIYIVEDSMLDEAIKVAGLKKFFKEFDNMSDKEAIDVMLWEEYLMYAQIFGMAEKVAKQFKKLYPDVITDMDYDTFVFINSVSYSGMASASSAYSAAQAASSYSSGGGGFSSGGGGGGSFGGGGGSFGGGSR